MSIISNIFRFILRKPAAELDIDKLKEIENYRVSGDIDKGIEVIKNYPDKLSYENQFANYYLKLVKARFLTELQEFDNAMELVNEIKSSLYEHPVIQNLIYIELANIYRAQGEFTEALEILNKGEEFLNELRFIYPEFYQLNKSKLYNVKAKIFNRTGKFEQSIDLLKETLELLEVLDYSLLKAEPLNDLGIAYASTADPDNGILNMQRSLSIYEKAGNDRQALKLINNLGLTHNNLGNPDQALSYYEKALDLSRKLEIKQYTASILQNIGILYQERGELDKSMESFQEALVLFEELGNKHLMAYVKNNIGNIYKFSGDIDKALIYYDEAQVIWKDLESKNDLAILYNNMADAYNDKGMKNQALEMLKQSVDLSEEVGNYNYIIHPLSLTIEILVEMDRVEEAKEQLQRFEKLLEKVQTKLGERLFKLSKAIILLQSERVVNQAEAQKLLTELVEDTDMSVQYAIKAYLKLANLLLQELKISGSEEALQEFKELVEKLNKLTESEDESTNIVPIKVNVLLLRSKLALIDLKLEESQHLLDEAYDLAKSSGLQKIAHDVNEEREAVKNQMMKYKKMVDTNASLYERLQESQIENYLKKAEGILKK